MIIKKFVGKNEEEAVAAAKKELGEGLVVMNVRQVKPKGIFAIFKGKQTEVTVALEEERETVKSPRRDTAQTAINKLGDAGAAKAADPRKGDYESGQSSIEKKLDSLQTLLENRLKQDETAAPAATAAKAGNSGIWDGLEEGANTEKVPEAEKEKEKETDSEQDKFIRLLYNTMIDNEVDEKYANQILEDLEKNRKPNMPFDYILANVYQKIILKYGKSEGITPAKKGPKVVFFVGPTGVGKTTTIAKIASNYVVEEKKKAALVTVDTYRIAAAEQLRTYAQILEVPFRVLYSQEEFKEAIEAFKDYDYIFVDTAGHSHHNEEQMGQMGELLQFVENLVETQTFLVLSATTKYKDLLKIADSYRKIAKYQLIFTKLDETVTLGNLLNVKLYADTPIAYITCGQNVPNDIENFNPQKTVKQLLGGKA